MTNASEGLTVVSAMDIFSFALTVSSLVLAISAICLSFFFFFKTKGLADAADRSSGEIKSSVDRVEKLFDSLYSDTVTMLKEAVTRMGDQAFAGERIIDTSAKVDEVKKELAEELTEVLEKQGLQAEAIGDLRREFSPLLEKAMDESRELANFETLNSTERRVMFLIEAMIGNHELPTTERLERILANEGSKFTSQSIGSAVYNLGRLDFLEWEGPRDTLQWDFILNLTDKGRRFLASSEH